jgi:selenocysteine-specific translation elongation factor
MTIDAQKNLSVGVFHDETLANEIGKKGTASDIQMFNRKTDERVFTFMQSAGDKLTAKVQIMSCIDAAVVSLANINAEAGETILLLDAYGVRKGICIVPPGSDTATITRLTNGTTLESFLIKPRTAPDILAALEKIEIERDSQSPVLVSIDHSFAVKGVGEVVLGFVRKGTLKKHDKLTLLPAGKEVVVRSIQIHDKDYDSAAAGSRVGLALKGAPIDDLRRGSVLCHPGSVSVSSRIALSFEKNKFYAGELNEGAYHLATGMQVVPARISGITGESLVAETEKPVVYSNEDTFVILDLNAKKLHLVGKGSAL